MGNPFEQFAPKPITEEEINPFAQFATQPEASVVEADRAETNPFAQFATQPKAPVIPQLPVAPVESIVPEDEGFFGRNYRFAKDALISGFESTRASSKGTAFAISRGAMLKDEEEYGGPGVPLASPKVRERYERNKKEAGQYAQDIAVFQKEGQERQLASPLRPETARLKAAMGDDVAFMRSAIEAGAALFSNPVGVIADLGTESLPYMAYMVSTAVIGRLAGQSPTAGAVSGGAGSAVSQFGNEYVDRLQKGESHDEAWKNAAIRSGVIGTFDAVSLKTAGSAAGKIVEALKTGKPASVAAKEFIKETGKQAGLGGAGEAVGSLAIGEVPNPAAVIAEMAGETVTGPFDAIGTYQRVKGVDNLIAQQRVEDQAAIGLKKQERIDNIKNLAPLFDSLVVQIKANNPGISEIDAFKQAGERLATSGGIDLETTKPRTRRTKPSVPVLSGEEAIGDTTTESTEAGVEAVGVSGTPVGDVGSRTEPVFDTLDPTIKARAAEIVAEGLDQGADIPMDLAVERATTELTETTETTPVETATTPVETTALATTPAETTAASTESIVETPATDPVGFARAQAIDSFDRRNSSDYSDPEEAIDFGLDNLNDTLTEYGVTDPFIREQAVETYQNEIARLKKETTPAETVSLDQVTSTTSESQLPINPETGLKPPGRRGRKAVVRTPEEQAAAEGQRKDRQKVGKDSIRTAEKAQKIIEKPFNQDDYATLDEARAAGRELQQERMNALIDAFTVLNDRNISPTAKAKQVARTVVDHPSVDPQEKQIAQARAKQTQTARSGSLGRFANSDLDPAYLIENFGTADKVLAHILRTGNAFEKLLAQRLKPFLKGIKVVIVNNPKTDIPDAKTRKAFKGATGLYAESGKDRVIYLSNLRDLEGINNVTFLHEAVHGGTMAQINAYIEDRNSVSPQARAAIENMQNIMIGAFRQYAILNAGGRTDGVTDQLYKLDAFEDLKEFVAYGLTQPEMQNFLKEVPGKYTFNAKTTNLGLLTRFVQSIRKLFNMGPQYDSAFQDLVIVTDQLLSAKPPQLSQLSQGTITAAAKKVKAQNKTLNKIFKSKTATDMNAGIGQLMMQTRNASDALRLLRAVFDSLTVNAVRRLLPVLTTMDITRWAGDRINSLKIVNDGVQDMAGMRAKMIRELAERVPEWIEFGRKYEEGGRTLGNVMNASTLLGVDPSIHSNLSDALKNDQELQRLQAEYQAALTDPNKSPKQRSTIKGNITKRENDITVVYEGGTVTNPHTGEKYVIQGWNKLGTYGKGKGHEIYVMARDAYKDIFNLHQKLLVEKITKSNIPGAANQPNTPKGKLIAQITQSFQEAQQLGVYFPLMRYGNFWLRIGKGKSSEFYMFESASARNNYARKRAEELKRPYNEVLESQDFEIGDQLDGMRQDIVESSQMLKDIFKTLEDASKIDPNTGKAGISDVDAIKDQVYQMFLMTLPDKDIRKKFTHRQGKTGFSADVLRNFIVSQHTAANQLSRLAYADQIRLGIGSSYAELAGNPDALKLRAFVDEVAMRATTEMNPQVPGEFNFDKLASIGNQAVFYYMLTAPKSALVQLTQLPLVGLPVLAAEYGGAALAVAARYSNLFNKLGITKRDANGNIVTKYKEPSINDSNYINKHPDPVYRKVLKRAWEAAQDKDIFMSTYAADNTARASVPTGVYEGAVSRSGRTILNFMGGAFHHLERIGREIVYMSAFELEFARATKEGLSTDVATDRAINTAVNIVYESLFNYNQYNKPRLMKTPITRVATQFMTYPLQMTSYLVRNFYSMLPFLNKTEKKEAAVKFFGTMFMTSLFAGVVGLPGYSMILGVAEGVRDALRPDMDDEDADEDYDIDDEGNPLGKRSLRLWGEEWFIPTYFGPESSLAKALGLTDEQALTLQRSIKMGPVSALTDLNVGSSVSLDGLWFRDDVPAKDSEAAFQEFVFSTVTGPLGSMGLQMAAAFDDINDGEFNRALEKLAPAFFRGPITAVRLAREGAKTTQGAEIREAEFYTTGKLVGQALGFQSTEVAELQRKNFKAKQIVLDIQKQRKKVLESLDRAVQKFENNPTDTAEENIEDALIDVDRYNYKNGIIPITQETVNKSLEGRAKRRGEAVDGLMLSPKEAPFVYPLLEKSRVDR